MKKVFLVVGLLAYLPAYGQSGVVLDMDRPIDPQSCEQVISNAPCVQRLPSLDSNFFRSHYASPVERQRARQEYRQAVTCRQNYVRHLTGSHCRALSRAVGEVRYTTADVQSCISSLPRCPVGQYSGAPQVVLAEYVYKSYCPVVHDERRIANTCGASEHEVTANYAQRIADLNPAAYATKVEQEGLGNLPRRHRPASVPHIEDAPQGRGDGVTHGGGQQ